MRNYITLNGKNSNEINGLLIQELPPISKPQIRTEVEEIDGRDGDIVTKLGFAAYDKEFTVGLYKDFDINAIIAYFNSEGTVVFSNEPDKYYNYQIIDQIDFERLVRYRTATVRMHCQPFKYSNTEGARTLGNKGTASGEGSFITLDNTPEAQFSKIDPKGNAEQDGTPSPDSPVPVEVVTGEQAVNIMGKNLFDQSADEQGSFNYITGVLGNNNDRIRTLPIGCLPNTEYTISANQSLGEWAAIYYAEDGTFIGGNGQDNITATSKTWTSNPDAKYMRIRLGSGSYPMTAGADYNIMLSADSTPQTYEPYQGQEFEVNLGKNLIQNTGATQTINGVTFTHNSDGSITASGTATNTAFYPVADNFTLKAGTYTLGSTTQCTSTAYLQLIEVTTGSPVLTNLNGTSHSSFTTTGDKTARLYYRIASGAQVNLQVYPQLEKGSTATSYAPYFTPIELAKIPGTSYKDKPVKIGDTWYIRKMVGKVVLDGTESGWTWADTARYTIATSNIGAREAISDHFTYVNYTGHATTESPSFDISSNLASIGFHNKDITSLNNFKTWLGAHNTTVYYALAEPVDEEITNETLISQLEALYNQAHTYKGRTHVAAIAQGSNAPHIIEAEVQRSSDGNITNNGNIVSKPTLTIYGSGNIGVSLNGYQIFEITLGDEEYITIDTAAMEAYKDTLDNLKNRLVNGDYSKFALRPGSNMIEFSGTVSKCVISKYSRWL